MFALVQCYFLSFFYVLIEDPDLLISNDPTLYDQCFLWRRSELTGLELSRLELIDELLLFFMPDLLKSGKLLRLTLRYFNRLPSPLIRSL